MNEFDIMVKKQEELEELKQELRYPQCNLQMGMMFRTNFIVYCDNKTVFQSYNSIIAIKYDDGRIVLGSNWDYSTTTGKYRNQFLGEGIATTREKIANGTYSIDRSL